MISFDEAVAVIRRIAAPVGTLSVPIHLAAGRVLAEPVIAWIDSPRADVSAMDGYAVRDADLSDRPVKLAIIAESFAGSGWNGVISAGQCARIFTGATVPEGADRVIMQEMVTRDGATALIVDDPGPARHIRARASDFRVGEEMLAAGRLLDKRAIVAAAGADLGAVIVHTRPRVAIVSTGDELVEPGCAVAGADSIPDSVALGVAALVAEWGGETVLRERAGDSLDLLTEAARRAVDKGDLVVVTGGASVGERDFAKAMFAPLGLEPLFEKVAIKPGKPVWLGRVGDRLMMGLPGNPTSALVTARLLLAPLLAGLSGRDPGDAHRWRPALLAAPLLQCGGRETFHRARWAGDLVELIGFQDSSAQRALAEAELLVRQRPDAPAQAAGEAVQVLAF
ncbi:molybdopterin molybdotransferase MoeA [Sphingomonas mesophila]|uniref:molybdopterin molybdotransferase MoeA n=1 Tax=Sphingomonas mesophila TaxID=2303576 RepID=UPI000E576EEE|nr:molybdopterin molybdotransferase MoeA [Sphingomonas mesophila]